MSFSLIVIISSPHFSGEGLSTQTINVKSVRLSNLNLRSELHDAQPFVLMLIASRVPQQGLTSGLWSLTYDKCLSK